MGSASSTSPPSSSPATSTSTRSERSIPRPIPANSEVQKKVRLLAAGRFAAGAAHTMRAQSGSCCGPTRVRLESEREGELEDGAPPNRGAWRMRNNKHEFNVTVSQSLLGGGKGAS